MIAFTKTALPFGWLGNMSAHPVTHQGQVFRTAEALFQALRFNDPDIIEQIRAAKSPMGAKMVAKRNKDRMAVAPGSAEDVKNMEAVLRLKVAQHPALLSQLRATGQEPIVEDCTRRKGGRNLFWGAALVDGQWVGANVLGKLWERIRGDLP
jgi:predicted NAD-dependent protein-ADP-ribosyltransferase YbiA (DUF1768 family)